MPGHFEPGSPGLALDLVNIVEIINRVPRMMSAARDFHAGAKHVGLVPTMGALHEGHLSLMTRARELCDILIVSIFVNPAQFGPDEDFNRYPRDLARDAELAFGRGVDFIFAPSAEEMFPLGFSSYLTIEGLSTKLEGASRPGHFRGVTTVIAKLFNIVRPNFAFFGRKDAQQVVLIKRMVRDLAMDTEIVVCPTVREEDGLALSSRNAYLSTIERKQATVLRRALERGRTLYHGGERDAARLVKSMESIIEGEPLARIDYVAISDAEQLEPIDPIPTDRPVLISLAVHIGQTRLIDNIVINGEL
ncbi:MAG TPA: pantoate--beta-alanine ligase [Blastocatellia bacterium]|nr:pantoate--beta-alanine ligase [Blastocatellia bacterium]